MSCRSHLAHEQFSRGGTNRSGAEGDRRDMGQAAARVAGAVGTFVRTRGGRGDAGLPVRIRAWDGSEAGAPADSGAPVVVLNHRRALRRLLWQPGEMGLAHAYVSGDLDVDGDLG